MTRARSAPDPETVTLFVGSAHGDFATVRRLLEADPSLLQVSAPWQETAIQAATHMANRQIIDYLLERGATFDIYTAAVLGQAERVQAMLDIDPSLARSRGVHGFPILFFPVIAGYLDIAELLVTRGASIDDGEGSMTPLHGAAAFDQPEMAAWLIGHGASTDHKDFEGKTPHEVAVAREHGRVAELLAQGAPS